MSILHPTLLAGLTPPAAAGDVIEAGLLTSLGHAVSINADGTYTVAGDDGTLPLQFFSVRLFDNSAAAWHLQSPFRVFLGGTVRVPELDGALGEVLQRLVTAGLEVELRYEISESVAVDHVIGGLNISINDLVTPDHLIVLRVSGEDPAAYADQYASLLPPGALATESDSTLNRLWLGVTTEMRRADGRTLNLMSEALPSQTDEMLDDWESEYGLPDPCVQLAQTDEQRRAALTARITGVGGQTPGYFIDLASRMGFPISIVEEQAFQVGRDGAGDGIGSDEWSFAWSTYIQRATSDSERELLECVFNELKPAHTVVQFFYT